MRGANTRSIGAGIAAAVMAVLAVWMLGVVPGGLGVDGWRAAVAGSAPGSRERLALVIGNARYSDEAPLVNTGNDARDIADKLEGLGFRVTRHLDLDRRALGQAVTDFVRRVRGSQADALIYYSGHGLQVGGKNYLVPVDARIRDELDVPNEAIPVDRLLAGLGERGDEAVNLVILDACRNNPFQKDGAKSIGDKGLARVTAPSGTLILYATRPGETASDNPRGRNGLFTQHLLEALDAPGQQVEDAFKQVAADVYRASGRQQSPWFEGVLFGRFYFAPPQPGTGVGVAPPPPPAPPDLPQGYLQILTNAPGSRVWVGETSVGTLDPGRALNLERGLPAGPVEVRVSAPGYREARRTVTIRPHAWEQVSVVLQPEAVAPPPPPPPRAAPAVSPSTPALARAAELPAQLVQQALSDLGHYRGRIDGLIGPGSQSAIRSYQKARGYGESGELDPTQTVTLIQDAAAAGHATSQNTLGMMSAEGIGMVKDEAAARQWFTAAARQGNAFAAFNLAVMYRDGRGGKADRRQARDYFEQANTGGYPQAAAALSALGR